MAKKSTKKFTPAITVDLTNCTSAADVYYAFAKAKMNKHLMHSEIESFVNHTSYPVYITVYEECKCNVKKPNVFKRFWNWLTK